MATIQKIPKYNVKHMSILFDVNDPNVSFYEYRGFRFALIKRSSGNYLKQYIYTPPKFRKLLYKYTQFYSTRNITWTNPLVKQRIKATIDKHLSY